MKITVLIENTSINDDLLFEHGLSLYIETGIHKILFDTGKSNRFLKNSKYLGIDLKKIDIGFLSHGHYDHGGGLKDFFKKNSQAKIYINEKAFNSYYAKRDNGEMEYIGIDEKLKSIDRFIRISGDLKISEELEILSNVQIKNLFPESNNTLYENIDGEYINDSFSHEQNLIIRENGKVTLLTGCAHKGIVNILESYKNKYNSYPDYIIGGFHLYKYCLSPDDKNADVIKTADFLKATNSKFYTFHCTGVESYKCLQSIMGNSIEYLATGDSLIL